MCDEKLASETVEGMEDDEVEESELTRPSEYLRAHCALCFGGSSKLNEA